MDEDAAVRHGQSSRRAYFRELKKVLILSFFVYVSRPHVLRAFCDRHAHAALGCEVLL